MAKDRPISKDLKDAGLNILVNSLILKMSLNRIIRSAIFPRLVLFLVTALISFNICFAQNTQNTLDLYLSEKVNKNKIEFVWPNDY